MSQPAETREATLPDGSKATLNAQSSLAYSASTWQKKPEVLLEGEAFFINKKDKRFFVRTHQGDVELINAQANVYARGKTLEVKCTGGRAQVSNPQGSERVLLASKEQVSVENGRMQRRLGLQFFPSWSKGESVFQSADLSRVLEEIGRQYAMTMVFEKMDGTFSGRFNHKDLEQALTTVCKKAGLHFEIQGDTVRILP